jgi:transcription initiation factor TFIIIB Brf1 subunit/transcription initiation factor TFIIB
MEVEQSWLAFDLCRQRNDVYLEKTPEHICNKCGGSKVFYGMDSFGVQIDLPTCTNCGAVDSEYISDEPEWRYGPEGQGPDPCRVGAPENLDHFSGAWNTGTIIKANGKHHFAKRLAVRQMHCNVLHKDRSLFHAYKEMDEIGKGVLRLPDCIMYNAKIKYKKFTENVLTRGAVRNGIKANCVFQACREYNCPRTVHEIAEAFKIPARDLSRTFDMYQEQNPETKVHVITPADLIPRFFCSINHIPEKESGRVRMKIINACKSLEDSVKLMGRTPKAVACAVTYVMLEKLGVPIGKAELCKICDVSGPTLSKIESIVKSELPK